MTTLPAEAALRGRDVVLVAVVAVLWLAGLVVLRADPPVPSFDALVYIQYALALGDFGVFGLYQGPDAPPPAGFLVGPLYPAFLALLLEIDAPMRDGLLCLVRNQGGGAAPCELPFGTLLAVQTPLMAVFPVSVWLVARLLSGRRLVAWAALAFAVFSGYPLRFAQQFLTEALTLPLYGLFTLFLLLAYRRPGSRLWPLLTGASLGLLALNKPTYAYVFWFLAIGGAGLLLLPRLRRSLAPALLGLALAYAALTGPWTARNALLFGQASLTGNYGERTLCHRLGYNRMSAAEWGAAFLYWFRYRGKEMARALLPEASYARLRDEARTFMAIGVVEVCQPALRASGGQGARLGYLIETEILGHPVRHALVSLPLAWRGMFIGKRFWWGIAGWLLALWLLVRDLRRRDWAYPLLCLPAGFLVAFHAAVSISEMRYHITLVPVLAYALAVGVCLLLDRLRARRALTRTTSGRAG